MILVPIGGPSAGAAGGIGTAPISQRFAQIVKYPGTGSLPFDLSPRVELP